MRVCPQCGGTYPVAEGFCPMDGARLRSHDAPQGLADDPFATSLLGRVLDRRYRLDEIIGLGGMGVVFRATHVLIGKVLAVKVLRREHARGDVAQRFLLEARLASSLKHPNVVEISDFGELEEGGAYFVMEHLVGRTLADRIDRDGPMKPADAIAIALQICQGMAAAHALGVVHRDLKPDNVFVVTPPPGGDAPLVKLLDFGIARAGPRRITLRGAVLGTPEYMAPEQALGQDVDLRADLYGLGVILFEMLTATVPFHDAKVAKVMELQIHAPPPHLGARRVELETLHRIDDVVQQLLAKDREARPSSAEAVGTALIAAIGLDLGRATAERLKRSTLAIGSGLIAESNDGTPRAVPSEPTSWRGNHPEGVRPAAPNPLLLSGPVPTVPRGGTALRPHATSPARPVVIGALAAVLAGAVTFGAAHWLRDREATEARAREPVAKPTRPPPSTPPIADSPAQLRVAAPPRPPTTVTASTEAPASAPASVTPDPASTSDATRSDDEATKPEPPLVRSSTKRKSNADSSAEIAPRKPPATPSPTSEPHDAEPAAGPNGPAAGNDPPAGTEPKSNDRRMPGDLKDPFPAN